MKPSELATKYNVEQTELLADIMALDLTGAVEMDKQFALHAEKDSAIEHVFTAHITLACTVEGAINRAVSPIIIKWQNSHRRGDSAAHNKAETLEQADARLYATPKVVEVVITAPNEREMGGDPMRKVEKSMAGLTTLEQLAEAQAILQARIDAAKARLNPNAA